MGEYDGDELPDVLRDGNQKIRRPQGKVPLGGS